MYGKLARLLEAKSITRRFGPILALDGVNFVARVGEIHALLGENGVGKTTLMKVFPGGIRPDAGAVLLISSDLDELLAIASRLFVISRLEIHPGDPQDRSPERLGLLMAGRWSE